MSILQYKRQINIIIAIAEQDIWCWWIGQVGEWSDMEQKWKRVCLTPYKDVIAPIKISEAVIARRMAYGFDYGESNVIVSCHDAHL